MSTAQNQNNLKAQNKKVIFIITFVGMLMLSLSYAAVPLYDIFCRVTGFGGTTQIASSAPGSSGHPNINIRFESNITDSLNWDFYSKTKTVKIPMGEEKTIYYFAKNLSDEPIVGTATFNVTPAKAGQYFMKIDCFCFVEQLLNPGESMNMPVTFFIDPDLYKDENVQEVNEITLSYTFMKSMDQSKVEEQGKL
ncbi:MAG: cytochrome c oxidase assembly protein CtaG [Alphaproteobacteria bacterium]|jgi:cytochrome c oxidase assembly protein subunit 11|nr:MAG: cytochrome c oxidase assembly protein CtaG [Alphaproteobacteria bacterium]